MYDPLVGRFLSPDNVIQSPDNTQNYNRYTYCLNNPLKYNDPSGWLMCPGSGGFTPSSPTNMVDFSGHSSEELNNNNGGGGWGGNGGALPFDYGTIYNTWFGYSDWKKSCSDNTYRGSNTESNARYWSRVLSAVSNKEVSAVIFGGSRTNRYQDLLGFNYTDGSSYYFSDHVSDHANSNITAQSGEEDGNKELFEAFEAVIVGARTSIDGVELAITEFAGARTYYTTFSGGTKYIGKTSLLGYCEVLGKYTFYGGVFVNIVGARMGEQSWGKAALNIGIEALPFIIGAGPGMVIGVIYFTVDKTVGWDKVLTPTPNQLGTFIDANGNMGIR